LLFVRDLPDRQLRLLAMPYLGGAALAQVLLRLRSQGARRRFCQGLLAALDACQGDAPAPASPPVRAHYWLALLYRQVGQPGRAREHAREVLAFVSGHQGAQRQLQETERKGP